jgi:hypothetical protein
MGGATSPLPNTPPWRGAQLKHRDNFTLLTILNSMIYYKMVRIFCQINYIVFNFLNSDLTNEKSFSDI